MPIFVWGSASSYQVPSLAMFSGVDIQFSLGQSKVQVGGNLLDREEAARKSFHSSKRTSGQRWPFFLWVSWLGAMPWTKQVALRSLLVMRIERTQHLCMAFTQKMMVILAWTALMRWYYLKMIQLNFSSQRWLSSVPPPPSNACLLSHQKVRLIPLLFKHTWTGFGTTLINRMW